MQLGSATERDAMGFAFLTMGLGTATERNATPRAKSLKENQKDFGVTFLGDDARVDDGC